MTVELIAYTPNPEELAGSAAAICTASDDPARALRGAMASGHESVLEHVSYTFRVEGVSRVLLAQLTRHRIASFSVESQRYVRIKDGDCMSLPDSLTLGDEFMDALTTLHDLSTTLYGHLLESGIPAEDARYVLPQGVQTKLIMTMNARELRHFFALRCCNRAQREIRDMADLMLELCRKTAPAIFADAGPGCVRGTCPEGKRSCGHPRK